MSLTSVSASAPRSTEVAWLCALHAVSQLCSGPGQGTKEAADAVFSSPAHIAMCATMGAWVCWTWQSGMASVWLLPELEEAQSLQGCVLVH